MQDGIMVLKNLSGMDYIGDIVDSSPTDFIVENMYAVMVTHNHRTGVYDTSLVAPIHPDIGAVNSQKHGCVDKVYVSRATNVLCLIPTGELLYKYQNAVAGVQSIKTMPGSM
jgi:hypothetical protein